MQIRTAWEATPIAAALSSDPPPLIAPPASSARASAVVAISYILGTALGGGLALLVGLILGEGPQTDSFLAAYSAYLVFILFGANLRVSLVPIMGAAVDEAALRERATDAVRRLTTVGMLASVALAILSPLIGRLLNTGSPGTAIQTLALLSVATYCQIGAAAMSAVLAAGRRFTVSALLYVGSSGTTLLLAAALMPSLRVLGAGLGVIGGALILYVGHLRALRRYGFAAGPTARLARERSTWVLAGRAMSGAAVPLAGQINLTIALAAVAGTVGVVTAYTYGYFIAVLLSAVTAASLAFVSMPGLLTDLDRRGRVAADEYMRTLAPLGAFFYVPVAAGAATLGRPVLDAVLGGTLAVATLDLLWDVLRIFLLMALLWVVAAPASTLALSMQRFRGLALLAVGGVLAQVAVVALLAPSGARAVAAGHAVVAVSYIALAGVLVFGRQAPRAMLTACTRSLPALGLAVVFPLAALSHPASWELALALAAGGLVVYVAAGYVLWPSVAGIALRSLLVRRR